MRIINSTDGSIALGDLHRGNAVGESEGTYLGMTAKSDSVVPAKGSIDIMDTEDAMLSYELGNLKTFINAGYLSTLQSMTGKNYAEFAITGANETFIIDFDGTGEQTFTLPTGNLTTEEVVLAINSSASGFVAEESARFFRTSNQDNITGGEVEGDLGNGMGQRTEGILAGFITLVGAGIIEIKGGTANEALGFLEGDFTKVG